MKESIQESGQKPTTSFSNASEFHAFLYEKRSRDALRAVAEMSKHPVSLEDKIRQTHWIQAQLRTPQELKLEECAMHEKIVSLYLIKIEQKID